MSAYVLPNSILLLAIVATIILVARRFPEAARQLEESSPAGKEPARDVLKRWLLKLRGGAWAFWRFVLEGKGLRDPKGSKFRMRQLLEQNRVLKSKAAGKAKIVTFRNAPPAVSSAVSTPVAAVGVSTAAGVAVNELTVAAMPEPVQPMQSLSAAAASEVAHKSSKVSSRRKAVVTPVNPDEIMRQAKTSIDAKEFLQARRELEQVAGSFQESPVFWARLGYVQYHLGAYAEAVRCYQKSLALDSNQANRYYNLALAHEAAQEHAESMVVLDQALKLDPGNKKYQQTRDALKTM